MYGVAAAIGAACLASLMIGGWYLGTVVPEWVAQLTWLAVVLGGSAVCGYLRPRHAWRWGAIIVGVQPLCLYVLFLLIDESSKPSSAFGGMAAVYIFGFFMVFVGPLAMLASHGGAGKRAGQQSRRGTSP